jgi:hypothetical protein
MGSDRGSLQRGKTFGYRKIECFLIGEFSGSHEVLTDVSDVLAASIIRAIIIATSTSLHGAASRRISSVS